MKTRLIAHTTISDINLQGVLNSTSPESLILYCARVSNPINQTSKNTKLLEYCAEHNHWSIFEMADFVFEIETSRAIAAQILRHRSFSFQEFSMRYAKATEFETYEARRQDVKNRQNSIDDMTEISKEWFKDTQKSEQHRAIGLYNTALQMGIAKEQARFLLPLSTKTTLYQKGSLRSWIHYINIRTHHSTQKEHRDIALSIQKIFIEKFPILAEALNWK